MLAAHDAGSEAWQIESDLAADQAGLSLALDVPDGDITVAVLGGSPLVDELCARRPDLRIEKHVGGAAFERDLLLVEAWAAGDRASLAPAGAEDAVEAARRAGKEAWLVVGVGRRLPGPLFTALRRRVDRRVDPGTIDFDHGPEQVDTNQFTRIVEPLEIACPCPPELLKGDP